MPPWLKKLLSSIATVASLRSCGILSLAIGWRMLSEWINPIREPSAAYTFETVPS